TATARVQIAPEELWLLARVTERAPTAIPEDIAKELKLDPAYMRNLSGQLVQLHLAVFDKENHLHPTMLGKDVFARVVAAWNGHLERLLAAWGPEHHAEVKAMLERLAKSLAAAPPLKSGSKLV